MDADHLDADRSPDPFLITRRLRLRPFTGTEGDLNHLVALDNDPGVRRFIDNGRTVPRETVRDETLPRLLGRGFWAAEEHTTGQWLGWFSLEPEPGPAPAPGPGPGPDPGSGSVWAHVELGYRLRRSAWDRGYATEGARALVHKAFSDLGTRRVSARTMTVNVRSRRVMEKAGLRYVRTFFADWPETIEGSDEGDVEYALTREQWEEQKKRSPTS